MVWTSNLEEGCTYLYVERGGSVQMECGFRPRDRDRTAERMEGFWMGFGPLLRGCWAAHKRGFCGCPVNRWSIKRSPNGTKLDRRSTGSKPRPHVKPRSILRMFNTRSRRKCKRGRRGT